MLTIIEVSKTKDNHCFETLVGKEIRVWYTLEAYRVLSIHRLLSLHQRMPKLCTVIIKIIQLCKF